MIHPTAIIDPGARLGEGVEVGPYCIVGPGVELGDGCWLQHHVTVMGPSRIGPRNRFYAYCSIGQQTQDLKYAGEPTHLEIGEGNCFREACTVHRATAAGAVTKVGSRGNFLAYSHIAHDCVVGDGVIFSNNGTIAGHVVVGHGAIIGGLTAVHQFCRIGEYSITGGCSKVVQDVPPYVIADGNPACARAINAVGLERAGFPPETVRALKESFRILYRKKLTARDAARRIAETLPDLPQTRHLVEFVATTERGLIRGGKEAREA